MDLREVAVLKADNERLKEFAQGDHRLVGQFGERDKIGFFVGHDGAPSGRKGQGVARARRGWAVGPPKTSR